MFIVTSICKQYSLACDIGYIGINCDVRCPFHYFGLDCQSTCNCSEENCDYVKGCRHSTSGMFYVWLNLPLRVYPDLSSERYILSYS